MKRGELWPGAIPMTGRRYGRIVVLGNEPTRRFPSGVTQRMVRVRCDCGREWVAQACHIRRVVRQCQECSNTKGRVRGRRDLSVRLGNGWTLAQIALVHGLSPDTVYRRWLRGWPDERLGDPLCPGRGRGPGLGRSFDLPERRRTRIPAPEVAP